MEEFGYKKLVVWRKADEFAFEVYTATKSFPCEEIYGITAQLREAALSIPTNIVEGYGR
jgi:four helix bundle protein